MCERVLTVCVCVLLWWNLHHINSERLTYGLGQTWSALNHPRKDFLYSRAQVRPQNRLRKTLP